MSPKIKQSLQPWKGEDMGLGAAKEPLVSREGWGGLGNITEKQDRHISSNQGPDNNKHHD